MRLRIRLLLVFALFMSFEGGCLADDAEYSGRPEQIAESGQLHAKSEPGVVIVARAFTSAPPQEVDFFFNYSDSSLPKRKKGAFVPAKKLLIPAEGNRDWFIGAWISKKQAQSLASYSVLILSEDGKYSLLPEQLFVLKEDYIGTKSPVDFQDEMKQWKTEFVKLEQESSRVSAELRRLQTDAEIIARSKRAIDLELRIQNAKQEIEGMERDIENLKQVVQLAKQSAPPRNFSRREIELTGQLKTLAEATKKAESDEEKRLARGEVELHNVRSVIEQTRFEDMERLRSELLRLRRYRQKLESAGGSGGELTSSDIESAADYLM